MGNDAYSMILKDFFRDAWRQTVGLPPRTPERSSHSELAKTEMDRDFVEHFKRNSIWSGYRNQGRINHFLQLMQNRMVAGALRYGRLNSDARPDYDYPEIARQRMRLYRKEPARELLVDAANLHMLEYHFTRSMYSREVLISKSIEKMRLFYTHTRVPLYAKSQEHNVHGQEKIR